MKLLITFIISGIVLGCVQSKTDVNTATNSATGSGNTIIDPISPTHFEIDYNPIVKLDTNTFPKGARGIGALRVYIDTASRVERFEIAFVSIENSENVIYSYPSDKDSSKIQQITNACRDMINDIKIKKSGNPALHGLEVYDLAIQFR